MSITSSTVWEEIKGFIDDTQLFENLNYKEFQNYVLVWVSYQDLQLWTNIDKASHDYEDFVENYKTRIVLKKSISENGRPFVATEGLFNKQYIQKKCCQGILSTNQHTGDFFSIKLLDGAGNETLVSGEAVSTIVRFEPNFDYNGFGGDFYVFDYDDERIFVTTTGNPDIPASMGGSIDIIQYERYIDKVSIYSPGAMPLKYIVNQHTNVLETKIFHDAGLQKEYQVCILYKA